MKTQTKFWLFLIIVLLLGGCQSQIYQDRLNEGTASACESVGGAICEGAQADGVESPVATEMPAIAITLEVSELPLGEGIGGGANEDDEDDDDQGEDDDDLSGPGAIGTAIQQTLDALPSSTAILVTEEVTVVVDNPVTVTLTPSLTPTLTPEISPTPPGLLLTQLSNTLTAIVISSTPTVSPTWEPGFTPNPTSTNTPTFTPVGFIASPTPKPCLALRFVADVTVLDGTIMQPNQLFFKTWRVQNTGSCTWASGFNIIYHSGFQLGGRSPLNFGARIPPGQYVNITIQLQAPAQGGTYRSNWWLEDQFGNTFGSGPAFDQPFYVEIIVPGGLNSGSDPVFPNPASTDPGFTPAP